MCEVQNKCWRNATNTQKRQGAVGGVFIRGGITQQLLAVVAATAVSTASPPREGAAVKLGSNKDASRGGAFYFILIFLCTISCCHVPSVFLRFKNKTIIKILYMDSSSELQLFRGKQLSFWSKTNRTVTCRRSTPRTLSRTTRNLHPRVATRVLLHYYHINTITLPCCMRWLCPPFSLRVYDAIPIKKRDNFTKIMNKMRFYTLIRTWYWFTFHACTTPSQK